MLVIRRKKNWQKGVEKKASRALLMRKVRKTCCRQEPRDPRISKRDFGEEGKPKRRGSQETEEKKKKSRPLLKPREGPCPFSSAGRTAAIFSHPSIKKEKEKRLLSLAEKKGKRHSADRIPFLLQGLRHPSSPQPSPMRREKNQFPRIRSQQGWDQEKTRIVWDFADTRIPQELLKTEIA